MKTILFLLFLSAVSQHSFPQSKRYVDDIFSGQDIQTMLYGVNTDLYGQMDSLAADIYFPKGDTAGNRALIVFVHGGGFHAGHRNDPAVTEGCSMLARKGYVVSSIDYRLGIDRSDVGSLFAALNRAVQDLNAFIRFAKSNAGKWNIDSNKIFITGASAGGITVLAKAFTKVDSAAAVYGVMTREDLEGKTNDLPNTSGIAGVFSLWGAILDTAWIQPHDVPVGCVQSIDDHLIPWTSGAFMGDTSIVLYGSYAIYQRARNAGIFTMVHSYYSSMHDLGLKVPQYRDTTVALMSNFFSRLIATIDSADSIKNKQEENGFLNKAYLVQCPGTAIPAKAGQFFSTAITDPVTNTNNCLFVDVCQRRRNN